MSQMSRVPKSRSGIRNFYRARAARWAQRAAELRIDPAMAAELAALSDEAEQAYVQQYEAMRAARVATLRYNELVKKLGARGAKVIALIRSQAEYYDPSLLQRAQLAPPAPKSPIGPPGKPFKFTTTLVDGGALVLKWQCRHPRGAEGTAYNVFRRLGHDGVWEYVGKTGKKTMVDDTIPPGTASLTYRIIAFRTTGPGPAAEFNVTFGGGRLRDVQTTRRLAA